MFERLKKMVEAHPYWFVFGGIVIFVIFYYISSSSNSVGGSSSGTSNDDLQLAQLSAAANAQDNQTSAALQAAQMQANVQTTAITSSQEATDEQTQAQLQAVQAQVGGQVAINQQNTQAQVTQTNDLAAVMLGQYLTQEQEQANVVNYLTNNTNVQGALVSQQLSNQNQTTQTVLGDINDFNGSDNKVALLESALGATGVATQAEQAQQAANSGSGGITAILGSLF